ncbi:hypothetical protein B0O99DRAFT_695828 [Bisporella sp. PMI_857]|nr:hypothetical protein B0O99DRAFT_695828 [Bisporella sp. PMI_857]
MRIFHDSRICGSQYNTEDWRSNIEYQAPDWIELINTKFIKVYTKEYFLSQAQSSEKSPENSQSASSSQLHGVDVVPDGHMDAHRESEIQISEAELTTASIFCTPYPDSNAVPQRIFPASPAVSLSNIPSSLVSSNNMPSLSESTYSNSVSPSDLPLSSEGMYSVRRDSHENSDERGRTSK